MKIIHCILLEDKISYSKMHYIWSMHYIWTIYPICIYLVVQFLWLDKLLQFSVIFTECHKNRTHFTNCVIYICIYIHIYDTVLEMSSFLWHSVKISENWRSLLSHKNWTTCQIGVKSILNQNRRCQFKFNSNPI